MSQFDFFPATGQGARSWEGRGNGEPEWMPAAEDVARARVRLERRGVLANLAQGLDGAELVPPGATPWLWWLGAALWLLIWPAAIALVAASRWPPLGSAQRSGVIWAIAGWLPWWLPLLLAAIHMLVLAGPVWYSARLTSVSGLRRRFRQVETLPELLALEPNEFEVWVAMLFRLIGYRVQNTQDIADHGVDLRVESNVLDQGLVQCKRYRGTVGEPTVRDLYGTLIHEDASYGWLVTTGGISRQAREWAAGKPIELWDGQRLLELASQYR